MKKLIALFLSLICVSNIFAEPLKQIIIFGDSLSDNGNLYDLLKTVPKSPPYYNGRFTNGPVWSEDVAAFYKTKSNLETINYAYGGATALFHSFSNKNKVSNPLTLDAEIYQYNIHNYFADHSQVLYSIWIGANDYLYDTDSNVDTLTTEVTQKISDNIIYLIGNGAKNFIVMNLPDLSRTPYSLTNNVGLRLHAFSVMHNQKLADALKAIKTNNPDVNITSVDIFERFNDLLDHPEKYNAQFGLKLTNTTEACWKGGLSLRRFSYPDLTAQIQKDLTKGMMTVSINDMSKIIANSPALLEGYLVSKAFEDGEVACTDPDAHVFWDDIHPSAIIHTIVGKFAIERLTTENPNI